MKATKGKPFFRGVHPKGEKSLSSSMVIIPLGGVEEVAIPLSQHIGKAAIPVVTVNQTVKRGELIAKADGFISSNVHASIAGEVTAIERRANGQGGEQEVIVIKGTQTGETAYMPPLSSPTAEEIKTRVQEAGIVGMGGAGFPTHVKLSPKTKVDTLVLNGAECEPYLNCDYRIMLEKTEQIVRGANYLATALGAERILIGIERNKPEAIAAFEQTELPVVALKKQYPMGSEKHLIYVTTGRKVPLRKLPADVGVSVQNVATALAVCEAIEEGKPLVERVVTLSGRGVTEPKNVLCPIGVSFETLAKEGGVNENTVKLVAGGPMTGRTLTGLSASVTKTSAGLLLLTREETNDEEPTPCINCGRCAAHCPMKLMPMQTEFYTAAKEYENADKYGGVSSCIECGACSYICPARRPLAQAIKRAKAELRKIQTGGKA